MSVIKLRVSFNIKKCWRDIEVLSSDNLYNLAETITEAFDFNFDHAFGFYSNINHNSYDSIEQYELFADIDEEEGISSESLGVKKTLIGKVFPEINKKMEFVFDYGDDWRFLVESTEISKKKTNIKYPSLVDSHGVAPEQYPNDEEYEELT